MKKLKLLLLLSFFVISLGYAVYFVSNNKLNSLYSVNTKNITGVVHEVYDGKYKVCNRECVIAYTNQKLNIGDKVEMKGQIMVPKSNTNFNLFSYKKYLYSNHIYYLFYADHVKVVGSSSFYRTKGKLMNYINTFQSKSYLNTFLIGNSSSLNDAIKDSYRVNGINHLLSISGMHITLFAMMLLKLLKKFKYKNIVVNSFLIFYVILTGFKLSAIRSLFLFLTSKKLKGIHALMIIFSVLIIYNPYYLYNVGFQFSFSITFFLLLFRIKTNHYLQKVFITSLISFCVSIPILASTNFEINLMSPILNIFFVPFVSLIIFPLTILTFFIPVFDPILFFLTNILENISLFLNYFHLTIILKKPDIWLIVLYYFCIVIVFYRFTYQKLLLIVLIIMMHYCLPKLNPYPVMTMLDVGQGDAMVIELEHQKKVIMVDTGGRVGSDYSISENIIIPYLKSRGIRKIDYLILSHGDYDHMGESINLVSNFKVDKVILNNDDYNELEQELIKVLNNKKIKYYKGMRWLNINNYELQFLNTRTYDNENDNSSVFYTELHNHKFLFMGDAGVEVEEYLIEKYNLKDIEVLKVGHHGSKTSSSKKFINEINPKYSIISVGKNNRYGHPNKEVIDNLSKSKIYRTDEDGSIMFKIKNNNKLEIETCSP